MTPTTLGILLGLAAATGQSVTYLQSRHFVGHENGGRLRLLVLAHLIQGAVSLAFLPFLWPANMPPLKQYLAPLLADSGAYLFAQVFLFHALRQTEASRVAPFLSIKIAILAGITCFIMGREVTRLQWIAVILAVGAAWLLNSSGGRLSGGVTVAIVMTAVGYAISDLFIRMTIDQMAPVAPLRAALICVCLSYIICGLAVSPLLGRLRGLGWADVGRAMPFSLTWLGSMAFLFSSFALVGVVLGNIVQSSRGLISILVAPAVARGTWRHLETKAPAHAVLRQAAVGFLMMLAVGLYVMKRWQWPPAW